MLGWKFESLELRTCDFLLISKLSNFQTFQTFKLPNFQTSKKQLCFQTSKLSKFGLFKLPNFQSLAGPSFCYKRAPPATSPDTIKHGRTPPAGSCAWGLRLCSGELSFLRRKAGGQIDYNAPPPEGWPGGHETQLMRNAAGQPSNLRGRAESAVIEVTFDADEGSLAFRVNDEAPLRVDRDRRGRPFAFPQGAQLRPWAAMAVEGDRVSFAPAFL